MFPVWLLIVLVLILLPLLICLSEYINMLLILLIMFGIPLFSGIWLIVSLVRYFKASKGSDMRRAQRLPILVSIIMIIFSAICLYSIDLYLADLSLLGAHIP